MRKGEKASMVVFWKVMEQADKETGEQKTIPLLRYYSVFHIDQCEGWRRDTSNPCRRRPAQTKTPKPS